MRIAGTSEGGALRHGGSVGVTHDIRPSRLVSYSYAADAGRAHDHEVQFEISVTSLRAANDSVPVALFVHGELTPAFERICRALGVMVHRQGSYADRLRRTCPRGATALALYPVLHKSLNFAELAATGVDDVGAKLLLQTGTHALFLNDSRHSTEQK